MPEGLCSIGHLMHILTIPVSAYPCRLPDLLLRAHYLRVRASPANAGPVYLQTESWSSFQPAESMGNMFPMEVPALEYGIWMSPGDILELRTGANNANCFSVMGIAGDKISLQSGGDQGE